MLAIRVDANEHIATGHVMRCAAIADEVSNLGEKVTFVTADDGILPFIKDYPVYIMHTDYTCMESETDSLISFLKENKINRMLVDSYFVTASYFQKIRDAGICVTYMDDLCEKAYPVDAVINYCPAAPDMGYDRLYPNAMMQDVTDSNRTGDPQKKAIVTESVKQQSNAVKSTALYLGADYIPLRSQFKEARKGEEDRVALAPDRHLGILVTTGGADNLGATDEIVRDLLVFYRSEGGLIAPDEAGEEQERCLSVVDGRVIRLHIMAGKYYEPDTEISQLIREGRVLLHRNIKNVAQLMSVCDIAISAAGSTLYELAAMGVIAADIIIADNQKPNAAWLDQNGYIPCMGDFRKDKAKCIDNIRHFLLENMKLSVMERSARKQKLMSLVDGHGAERVARLLYKEMG